MANIMEFTEGSNLSAVGRYDNENIMSPQFVQLNRESDRLSHVVRGFRISVIFISVSPGIKKQFIREINSYTEDY